ncbi:hypothetical protein DFH27DRAFT_656955 [Peziza echinospora]|nr:hypothetical protein DFH27DRAFT_656955 [Peziza echinospora]
MANICTTPTLYLQNHATRCSSPNCFLHDWKVRFMFIIPSPGRSYDIDSNNNDNRTSNSHPEIDTPPQARYQLKPTYSVRYPITQSRSTAKGVLGVVSMGGENCCNSSGATLCTNDNNNGKNDIGIPQSLLDETFVPWLVDMHMFTASSATDTGHTWRSMRTSDISSDFFSTRRRPDFCLIQTTATTTRDTANATTQWPSILVVADCATQVLAHQPAPASKLYGDDGGQTWAARQALRILIFCLSCHTHRKAAGVESATEAEMVAKSSVMVSLVLVQFISGPLDNNGNGDINNINTTKRVLAKYNWRACERTGGGGKLFRLARDRGVVCVAGSLGHRDIVDVATLQHGLTMAGTETGGAGSDGSDNSVGTGRVPVTFTNRIYSPIVLSQIGDPVRDSMAGRTTNTPTSTFPRIIAQALLGAFVAHASLYFVGQILAGTGTCLRQMCSTAALGSPTPATTRSAAIAWSRMAWTSCTDSSSPLTKYAALAGSAKAGARGAPHRTGTLPFISIGVLNGHLHTYSHDLESFLYVLLWLCIRPTYLNVWATVQPEQIAFSKAGQMGVDDHFQRLVGDFLCQGEGWEALMTVDLLTPNGVPRSYYSICLLPGLPIKDGDPAGTLFVNASSAKISLTTAARMASQTPYPSAASPATYHHQSNPTVIARINKPLY